MSDPCVVLFDDAVARNWLPLTLTRPAGELRYGAFTLRERAERVFGATCVGHLITCDDLLGYDEPDARPVLQIAGVPRDRDIVFLCSRAVPAWTDQRIHFDGRARLLAIGRKPVGWFAPAYSELPPGEFFDDPSAYASAAPMLSLEGEVLQWPWQMITGSADQIARDVAAIFPFAPRPRLLDGVHVIGDGALIVAEGAFIEPGTLIDVRRGPVWIDANATVSAFTKIVGPSYVGRNSRLLGGTFDAVTIGPVCKAHGEMQRTVMVGYSNKAHYGFLGYAYVGAWVNLGAMTANSDLKNNYGPVRIWTPSGEVDTGELKLGCLIGDHVKTAIGTLLNTGTVVGTGSNLFGTGIPPRYIPPFSWGWGDSGKEYELERFIQSAESVMRRRNVMLSAGQRAVLERAWARARRAP